MSGHIPVVLPRKGTQSSVTAQPHLTKYTSILPAVLPDRLRVLTRCHPRRTALSPAGPWSPEPGLGHSAAAALRLPPPGLLGKESPGKAQLPGELRGRGQAWARTPHDPSAGPRHPAPR